MNEHLKKLETIFQDVLENEALALDETLSTANCPDWDSVAMIQIILKVEAEFGVKFTTLELAKIKSVRDILNKIS